MNTLEIRRKLHDFVTEADDKKVVGIYLLLEDDINLSKEFTLSPQQLQILDEERERHISGETKSHSWEEVKQFVRRNKTPDVLFDCKGKSQANGRRSLRLV